ncbi:MAG: hypothetical protein AABY22_10625 [Nanoarchaeota archaeon]
MTIIQDKLHNQIIHFVDGHKRTLLNVVKVWQNTWTHVLLENGVELIINPDNVLAIEIEWLNKSVE